VQRAEDRSRRRNAPRQRRIVKRRVARPELGETKIEQLDAALRREQDVRRLEVAVDDLFAVRFVQGTRNLSGINPRTLA
jgi:hypothetical protein